MQQFYVAPQARRVAIRRRLLLLFVALTMLGVGFAWGVVAMRWRVFPYAVLEAIRLRTLPPTDPRTRFVDAESRTPAPLSAEAKAKTAVFVTFGQSNAANAGQFGYQPGPGVLNFFDGQTYRYEDPALGANGRAGSVWGRVGDRLIAEGMYEHVSFTLTAIGGRAMSQLRSGGLYDYFLEAYRDTEAHFGRVDAILIHQGEANHTRKSFEDYQFQFRALMAQLERDGVTAPLYLSRTTVCGFGGVDEELQAIKEALIHEYPGVLRGPNTDTLIDPALRAPDGCHFSAAGLDAFADLWLESLKAASEE